MRGPGRHRFGRQGRSRHMLMPALLMMMHLGPAHGYELMEQLKEFGMGDMDVSLIYRALHALEADGMVSSSWDEKESQGPPRRVYSLTEAGHLQLGQHLDELKTTRERINQILDTYESHMRNGKGDFHE